MTKNLKKLTLSITASALLAGNAFALDPAITNFGYIYTGTDLSIFDSGNPSQVKTITGMNGQAVGITSFGNWLYGTNGNSIVKISSYDGSSGILLNTGTLPSSIVTNFDGTKAYVSDMTDGTVSVVDTITNTKISTITVGTEPKGIILTKDNTKLYVANDSTISIIDTSTNLVIDTINTSTRNSGIVISPNGNTLYTTTEDSDSVLAIDVTTKVITSIATGASPEGIVISPDGSKLFTVTGNGGSIYVIDTLTNTMIQTINNPDSDTTYWQTVSISPDGSKLYLRHRGENNLYVMDTTTYLITTYSNFVSSSSYNFSSFISPNLLTGTLEIASAAQMLEKGFNNYVNFAGGTLKATGSFTLSNPVYLHDAFNITWDDSSTFTTVAGGTVNTNGYDVTFSGEVSGVGSLTKTGNGVLTLSANNTYTGNTNANGGTLAVTADTSSSNFIVNNSGILSGNGTVGNTTVKNGGVIYPTGTSTLNVDGNLTFENGSIYRLNANRLAQSGKIAVSGTATLDGNVEVKADNSGTWNTSTNYEILSANSISGTFDGVSSDLAFLTPTLQYTQAGKVNLTLVRNDITNEDVINTTDYDKELLQVAKALDKADEQNVSSMQDLFTVINGMNTAQAKDAYRQLLGTSLNNTHTISNSLNTFNTNLFDRLSRINSAEITGTNSGDEILIGSDNGKYNLWSRVLGGASKLNGDTLRSKVSSNSSGIQMGVEKISDDVVFGTSLAYIASDVNFKNDETKSDLDTYILGLYAQKTFTNNVFVNADVNVGQNKNQTSRTTPTNKAFSDPKSNTISTNLEVGYKFDLSNNLYLKPSIIGGYTHLTQDAYSETGAGGANLSIDKYNTNSSNLGVNLKTQKVFTQNNKDFADVEFGIGYVEEFGDTNKALNATFALAPNSGNFEIKGVDKDTNKFIASISTNYYLSSTSSLFASVNGAKNSDEESINGVLGVKIGF